MADSLAAGAFAFLDSAARLQDAGSRLGALVEVVERQVGARIERLNMLPPTAAFDPFLDGVRAAAAAAAVTSTATGAPARAPRKPPPAPVPAHPRTAPDGPSIPTGVARGLAVGTLVSGAVDDLLARITGGGAGAGAPAAATKPGALPKAASARALEASAARAGATSPTSLPAAALQGAGAVGQAVLDLVNGVVGPRKPATAQHTAPIAPSATGGPWTANMLPAPFLIEIQLAAITAAAKAAAKQAAQRPNPRDAVAPATAAPRAPSRLFSSVVTAAIDAAQAAASTPTRGKGSNGGTSDNRQPPTAETPREEDVVAAINRMLVDQAWLRGVDLR